MDWVVPEDTLGLFVEGRLVASTMVHRFRQSVRGVVKPMGGIAAVASYPEHRGSGHVARLLDHACLLMKGQGRPVSMLHPFRESFYERLGWVAAGAAIEIEVPTAALGHYLQRRSPPGWAEQRLAPAAARDEFQALLRETAPRYNGFTFHEREPAPKWENRSRDWLFVMIRGQGVLHAAARYEVRGSADSKVLRVRDPWWRDLAGRNALLRFLAKHRDQAAAVNLQLPYGTRVHTWLRDAMTPFAVRVDEKPWMVRVVDVVPALRDLPAEPEGRLTIEVSDERCPWNSGLFDLEAKGGTLRAAASPGPGPCEARLDQKALASLVYGSRSVEEVCDLGWMDGPRELLDAWFPTVPFHNTLGF
jgi:predicted acetyltransferase